MLEVINIHLDVRRAMERFDTKLLATTTEIALREATIDDLEAHRYIQRD